MDLKKALSIEDLRGIARKRVPRFVFDYGDGGSEDEVTLQANRESFERLRFRPRTLVDVSQRNSSWMAGCGAAATSPRPWRAVRKRSSLAAPSTTDWPRAAPRAARAHWTSCVTSAIERWHSTVVAARLTCRPT
jgi:hypothetical protein